MNMREGMNIFRAFAYYLWGKVSCPFFDYENPFKYIFRVCKAWGLKCFVQDQFYWPSYKAGFKFLYRVITGK